MARALLPARRLLRLRERVEASAKHELQLAQAALAQGQATLSSYLPLTVGTSHSAQQLRATEFAQQAARDRVVALEQICAERLADWQNSKRERRQAELLLEKRLEEVRVMQGKREVRDQEDWGRVQRAQQEKEEQP